MFETLRAPRRNTSRQAPFQNMLEAPGSGWSPQFPSKRFCCPRLSVQEIVSVSIANTCTSILRMLHVFRRVFRDQAIAHVSADENQERFFQTFLLPRLLIIRLKSWKAFLSNL